MPTYTKEAMNAALQDLRSEVEEMESAIGNMEFESGTGGVTDRASWYLQEFLDAMDRARKQQGEVAKLIIAAMAGDK